MYRYINIYMCVRYRACTFARIPQSQSLPARRKVPPDVLPAPPLRRHLQVSVSPLQMRKGQYSKLENEYSHQWDAGGDDAQGSKGGVPKGGVLQEGSLQEAEALPSPSGILRRRSDEEKPLEASQKQKMLRSDSKKSPSGEEPFLLFFPSAFLCQ